MTRGRLASRTVAGAVLYVPIGKEMGGLEMFSNMHVR